MNTSSVVCFANSRLLAIVVAAATDARASVRTIRPRRESTLRRMDEPTATARPAPTSERSFLTIAALELRVTAVLLTPRQLRRQPSPVEHIDRAASSYLRAVGSNRSLTITSSTAGTGASFELAASLTSSSNLPVSRDDSFSATPPGPHATPRKFNDHRLISSSVSTARRGNSHRIHNVRRGSSSLRALL
jgi:hypothetical protein